MTTSSTTREFTVPDSLAGIRLDKVAAQLAEGLSRARVKKAIDEGAVRVNGRKRPKGSLVDAIRGVDMLRFNELFDAVLG